MRVCYYFVVLRLCYYFVVLRLSYYFIDFFGVFIIEGYSDSDYVVEDRVARMICKFVGGNFIVIFRWFKGKGDYLDG